MVFGRLSCDLVDSLARVIPRSRYSATTDRVEARYQIPFTYFERYTLISWRSCDRFVVQHCAWI